MRSQILGLILAMPAAATPSLDGDEVIASVCTTDGAMPYHTAVCLLDGKAVGQTWAEHRNFLFNAIATRPDAP